MRLLFLLIPVVVGCAGGKQDKPVFNNDNNDNNIHGIPGFGDTCTTGKMCESGYCVAFPDSYDLGCTVLCPATSCPEGFTCRQASRNDATTICLPHSEKTCSPCSTDDQCGVHSDRCFVLQEIGGCLAECGAGGDCPDGFICSDLTSEGGTSGRYCMPNEGVCGCSAFTAGTQTSCVVENEHGSCSGMKECNGAAGWGACSAPTPGPELCDGEDNNCDGQVDEGLLGTMEHCSACNDTCDGVGVEGTEASCSNGVCSLSCHEGYYDPDELGSTGCECKDDNIAGSSPSSAASLGSFDDCDFTHTVTSLHIPKDANGTGPKDYFKYTYTNNAWPMSCWNFNSVRLDVPSSGVNMRICAGHSTTESTWDCAAASPGTSTSVELPEIDNGETVQVYFSVENIADPLTCGDYTVTIVDEGDI